MRLRVWLAAAAWSTVSAAAALEASGGVLRDTRQSGRRPALVVGLHGYGMGPSQIETLVAPPLEWDHVLVALPGPVVLPEGGRAWFPLEWGPDGQPGLNEGAMRASCDALADTIRALVTRHGTDPRRTYVVGYSQGGALALASAIWRPSMAAGFVALAGAPPPGSLRLPEVVAPVFLGHGTRDVAVPIARMSAFAEQLGLHGFPLTYRQYPVPHVVSAGQRRDVGAWLTELDLTRRSTQP